MPKNKQLIVNCAPARGFSLLEALLSISAIGILAAIAYVSVPKVVDSASATKLENDVATVNTAINVYLASGGDLSTCETAQCVLDKLKTTRSEDSAARHAGLDSSMIDRRLAARLQSETEAASAAPRAAWNALQNRFQISASGAGAVGEFYLDEALATVDFGEEDRTGSAIAHNHGDGWIWAYEDSSSSRPLGPTLIPVSNGTGTAGTAGGDDAGGDDTAGDDAGETAGDDGGDDGGDPEPSQQLLPPGFSIVEEFHPITDFPLQLTLSNPNPIGSSRVVFSYQAGPFQDYTGPITVAPNSQVLARVVSLNLEDWTDSAPISKYYQPVLYSIGGDVTGRFQNPLGPTGMVQSIVNGEQADFWWGETRYLYNWSWHDLGPQNHLGFSGQSFSDVNPGDSILVGTLNYYNGSILDGSEVNQVDLVIDVQITTPISVAFTVPYTLELLNTVNNAADPIGSADTVQIQSGSRVTERIVEGVRYQIELTFGNSTANGFTSVDQFHVLEGASASAELRAVYTPILEPVAAGTGSRG
ncbi:MAG: prepilin-type N-terminal cleavage/methylation domain-containing protein [Verrucomicrobiales bacterium]|jgi:prepilin-type N-terminal cleavage/methylation domain-containing protein